MQLGKYIDKKESYISKANEVEDKYGLPRNLLVGLLQTESGFREDVITGKTKSSAGAIGIAQFMPKTAEEYGIDPLNTDQAIDAAGRYLQKSYNIFGNWDDTLRSYNMGVQGVKDWKSGKKKLPKETAEYTGKVYKFAGIETPTQTEETVENITAYTYTPKPNMSGVNLGELVPEEEKTKEQKEIEEADKALELEDRKLKLFEQFNNRQIPQQQEEVVRQTVQTPNFNALETYQQIDQFVSNPIMQSGGTIPSTPLGQYQYPNQVVNVPTDGSITMQGVNYPLLGISQETGQRQMMFPNQEYFFKNTQNVVEVPLDFLRPQ